MESTGYIKWYASIRMLTCSPWHQGVHRLHLASCSATVSNIRSFPKCLVLNDDISFLVDEVFPWQVEIMVCWWCCIKTERLIEVIKVHPTWDHRWELKILEAIQQLSRNLVREKFSRGKARASLKVIWWVTLWLKFYGNPPTSCWGVSGRIVNNFPTNTAIPGDTGWLK